MTDRNTFTTHAASSSTPADADAQTFAIEAARLLSDLKCDEVVVFDVSGLSPVTDFVVIGTGTSDRQMKSVAKEVEGLGKPMGFARYGGEHDDATTWVVADFVEVVVHIFEPATRGHYDLEMMWGDAPSVRWRRA